MGAHFYVYTYQAYDTAFVCRRWVRWRGYSDGSAVDETATVAGGKRFRLFSANKTKLFFLEAKEIRVPCVYIGPSVRLAAVFVALWAACVQSVDFFAY